MQSRIAALHSLGLPLSVLLVFSAILVGMMTPNVSAQVGPYPPPPTPTPNGYPLPGGPIGSISGRVVDSVTGLPIQASVSLFNCTDFGCTFVTSQFSGDTGFTFTSPLFGAPLLSGAYYIVASSFSPFATTQTPAFIVADGQNFAVGDIAVVVPPTIGTVSGRVLDAQTNAPIPQSVSVSLLQCPDAINCIPFSFIVVGTQPDGHFSISSPSFFIISPGTFAAEVSSQDYTTVRSALFTLAANQSIDLGTIFLQPVPVISSISGRLVDSVTGGPVTGFTEPFANISLNKCDQFGCFTTISSISPDTNGVFRFDAAHVGRKLPAGDYTISFGADQYNSGSTDRFSVAEGQDLDLGAIKIRPFPVRFSNTVGCITIPANGGVCDYSVRVTSGLTTTLRANSWSIINSSGIFTNRFIFSTFQPEPARNLVLKSGASQVLRFSLRVPAGVPANTLICGSAYVSSDRSLQLFDTLGFRQLFCVVKSSTGTYRRLSEREMHDREQQDDQQRSARPGR